ncbi:hypothetical protein IFT84_17585 [Rhizobium sp. CFBP 8762]|uniref:hypothetical protein n=1 Tax=Rhizobium sp. CFBP 8762 TaxID=2775279 RepID=UPI00177E9EBD|nr:hypothetical protein [Rhizobium sp. CFBP 8762]MBD8556323.1 hypothetical protein [Rhizobium sp. CFBP 8762]
MRILSLDISKTAGFACYDSDRHISAIKCDVLEFPEKATIEYCADQMGNKVKALIREFKPDFVVVETALKMSPGGTKATIVSCMLHGAVLATVGNFSIPWGTIAPSTWRSIFFAQGFKPAFKIVKLKKPDKLGRTEKKEYLWKEAVVAQCELDGIKLPSRKTVSHNAAEAAAIAICWHKSEIHAGRYRPAFQGFLERRNSRAVPSAYADLFTGASA